MGFEFDLCIKDVCVIASRNNCYLRYFGDYDRRIEYVVDVNGDLERENAEKQYFFQVNAGVLKKRLELNDVTYEALERDFNANIIRQLQILEKHIDEVRATEHKEYLEQATLERWLSVLKRIMEQKIWTRFGLTSLERILTDEPEYMADEDNFVNEEEEIPRFFWGIKWPTLKVDFLVRAILEVVPPETVCKANVTDMVAEELLDCFDGFDNLKSCDIFETKRIFDESLKELRELSEIPLSQKAFQKMIFANAVTILETYMADMAKKCILGHRNLMRRYVETNPSLKDQRIALSELFVRLDSIDSLVSEALDATTFHNVRAAIAIYRNVLGIEIDPLLVSAIGRQIAIRHDIVHRNGRKLDGKQWNITQKDLVSLMGNVEQIAVVIETQIRQNLLLESREY